MQNRTDVINLSFTARLWQLILGQKKLFYAIGSVICGFVMSNSYIFGGAAPFGVSICAALPGMYSVGGALGAVIGYTFSANAIPNMKYIAAIIVVMGMQWLFGAKFKAVNSSLTATIAAFVSLLIASGALLLVSDSTVYDILLAFAEVFLGCGGAYFFSRTITSLRLGWTGATRADVSCLIISFAIIVMGLSNVNIAMLSVGRMLSVLAILLCARYGGEAGGAVCGITAGIAVGLSGGDYAFAIAAYGFGGMVAGVFGNLGRIPTAATFILINTVSALFTKTTQEVYICIFEIFVASLVFAILPQGIAGKLRFGKLGGAARPDYTTSGVLQARLEDVSGALKDICTTTRKVTQQLGKMEASSPASIYTKVAERVCYRCGMKTTCWQFKYTETITAMNSAVAIMKREGSLNKERTPRYFVNTCCKLDDFLLELNTQFQSQISREGVALKVSKVRSVITDQFEGVAMMMDEIANELCSIRFLHPTKTVQVEQYFEKQGISATSVLCTTDEFDHMQVQITIPPYQKVKIKPQKTALDLCTLMEAEFDLPQFDERESHTTVVYVEKATYFVEVGAYQVSCNDNRLCGDAWEHIRNKNGKAHFILSDGMGSGGSAAVDSAMASGLISRLISVGISHEAALKMVNSALLIKSGEESLATIDIATVDLYTARCDFYKAGAAPTFLVRGGKAGYLESTSLPAGILRGVAFEKSSVTLHADDIIVLISDGVISHGIDWVKSELESLKDCTMEKLSESLAMTAKIRRTDGHQDDITVVAIAIRK